MRVIRAKKALRFLLFGTLAAGVFSFLVMSLWNWVVPPVIGWHAIGFGQAFGLLILSKILFGGFRGPRGRGWGPRMIHRWEQLTPEEREKFRSAMRNRCYPGEHRENPAGAV